LHKQFEGIVRALGRIDAQVVQAGWQVIQVDMYYAWAHEET
jgi:hypothetical protein